MARRLLKNLWTPGIVYGIWSCHCAYIIKSHVVCTEFHMIFTRTSVTHTSLTSCLYNGDHLNLMWVWLCIVVNARKLKGQLDATDWFLSGKTYRSLNMFWAPLCPSSGAQRVIQTVAACGTWRFGLQVVGLVWSCELCVRWTDNPQLHTRPATCKPERQVPQAATVCITLWAPDDGHYGARNMLSEQYVLQ